MAGPDQHRIAQGGRQVMVCLANNAICAPGRAVLVAFFLAGAMMGAAV